MSWKSNTSSKKTGDRSNYTLEIFELRRINIIFFHIFVKTKNISTILLNTRVLRCFHFLIPETRGIRTPDTLIKSQVLYRLSQCPFFSFLLCLFIINAQSRNRTSDTRIFSPLLYQLSYLGGLRGQDLNLRPSGYEPDELPDCSTPRYYILVFHLRNKADDRTRTDNLLITNQLLCQLSHIGTF